jgi:hypothetical protein
VQHFCVLCLHLHSFSERSCLGEAALKFCAMTLRQQYDLWDDPEGEESTSLNFSVASKIASKPSHSTLFDSDSEHESSHHVVDYKSLYLTELAKNLSLQETINKLLLEVSVLKDLNAARADVNVSTDCKDENIFLSSGPIGTERGIKPIVISDESTDNAFKTQMAANMVANIRRKGLWDSDDEGDEEWELLLAHTSVSKPASTTDRMAMLLKKVNAEESSLRNGDSSKPTIKHTIDDEVIEPTNLATTTAAAVDPETAKWNELAAQEKLRKAQARRSVRSAATRYPSKQQQGTAAAVAVAVGPGDVDEITGSRTGNPATVAAVDSLEESGVSKPKGLRNTLQLRPHSHSHNRGGALSSASSSQSLSALGQPVAVGQGLGLGGEVLPVGSGQHSPSSSPGPCPIPIPNPIPVNSIAPCATSGMNKPLGAPPSNFDWSSESEHEDTPVLAPTAAPTGAGGGQQGHGHRQRQRVDSGSGWSSSSNGGGSDSGSGEERDISAPAPGAQSSMGMGGVSSSSAAGAAKAERRRSRGGGGVGVGVGGELGQGDSFGHSGRSALGSSSKGLDSVHHEQQQQQQQEQQFDAEEAAMDVRLRRWARGKSIGELLRTVPSAAVASQDYLLAGGEVSTIVEQLCSARAYNSMSGEIDSGVVRKAYL